MGHFQILGLFACFFLFACSDPPVFTPSASTATLRADIQTLQAQWKSERCPSNARKSQCDDLMQRGLQHCLKRNPTQKTRCIYTELYCTLFGGKACRF